MVHFSQTSQKNGMSLNQKNKQQLKHFLNTGKNTMKLAHNYSTLTLVGDISMIHSKLVMAVLQDLVDHGMQLQFQNKLAKITLKFIQSDNFNLQAKLLLTGKVDGDLQ